jgi:hypothetical protein
MQQIFIKTTNKKNEKKRWWVYINFFFVHRRIRNKTFFQHNTHASFRHIAD